MGDRPRKIAVVLTVVLFLLVWSVSPAAAHEGNPHTSPWRQWAWQDFPFLALTGVIYTTGLRYLWKRAGTGNGISRGRAAAFAGGLVVLFIALVSPLDVLSEQLFSAHMVQHLLLTLVAAPLFVTGRFPLALTWSLSPRWASRVWKDWRGKTAWDFLTHPVVASLLHAAALWFWHMPRPYQASLRNEWIHFLEHATFFLTAFLFWQVFVELTQILRSGASPQFGMGVFYIFVLALVSGLLGVLIAFSPYVWYPMYVHESDLYGLTALEDQQLAGTLMWVPAGIAYTASALSVMGRWLFAMESLENPQPQRKSGGSS